VDAFTEKLRGAFATYRMEDARLLREVRLLLAGRRDLLLADPRADGLLTARALSNMTDAVVATWFSAARAGRGLSLLALGGYGRGEMSPWSDVDLMVLYPDRADSRASDLAGALVAFLWDLGFSVGHSARSVDECRSAMEKDLPSATALLEARLLCGSRVLFRRLDEAVTRPWLLTRVDDFVTKKIEEVRARHRFYGGSPLITIPNVKESAGGIRDLHVAGWIAFALSGRKDFRVFREAGLLTEAGTGELLAAYGEVQRLRHLMHSLAGRKQDVLDFEARVEAASRLGFREEGGFTAPERLMGSYYRAALRLYRFLIRVIRFRAGCPAGAEAKAIAPGLRAAGGELYPVSDGALADPRDALAAAALAAEQGLAASPDLVEALSRAAGRVDDRIRCDRVMARRFLDLLGTPRAGRALRALDEAAFLGAYLPEFGRISCLAREDPLHQFTVDEHTLRAVECLEALGDRDPALGEELARVERIDLVKLSLLLHDVGKAGGRGHVARGTAMVPEATARLGLSEPEARFVRFLVEQHLLLSGLADRRAPREAAEEAAAVVGDRNRLRSLYLHTLADVEAAGQGALSGWREAQLRRLYEDARALLTAAPRRDWADEVIETVGPDRAGEARAHLAGMGSRYALEVDPSRVALHLDLVRRLADRPAALTAVRADGFGEVWIAARDAPGLFARVAATLSVHDLDIEAAAVYTREDGVALDGFFVTREGAAPPAEDGFWKGVAETLARVVGGELDPEAEIERCRRRFRPAPKSGPAAPAGDARLMEGISDRYAVVEVTGPDRPALLHDFAATIAARGYSIHHAIVATRGGAAMDTFYLSRPDGSRPEGGELGAVLADLRRAAGGGAA
jgi:[protein-PII] uridylyltransferase